MQPHQSELQISQSEMLLTKSLQHVCVDWNVLFRRIFFCCWFLWPKRNFFVMRLWILIGKRIIYVVLRLHTGSIPSAFWCFRWCGNWFNSWCTCFFFRQIYYYNTSIFWWKTTSISTTKILAFLVAGKLLSIEGLAFTMFYFEIGFVMLFTLTCIIDSKSNILQMHHKIPGMNILWLCYLHRHWNNPCRILESISSIKWSEANWNTKSFSRNLFVD